MNKVLKYVFIDIVKNRFTLVYTLCLAALSMGLYTLDDNASKATLSLLNIVLLFVPLVSIMFTTIYYYNSLEFIVLIMAQPIPRIKIFYSVFLGIALSLILSFLLGAGLPVLLLSPEKASVSLVIAGTLLTLIFCAVALLFAVHFKDKAKGMGISLIFWIFFLLIYDGILLLIMFSLNDYPLEKLFIGMTLFNPIDLARIYVLMQLDISALMGVTGAVFKEFFGTALGAFITIGMLSIWFIIPLWIAKIHFNKRDF